MIYDQRTKTVKIARVLDSLFYENFKKYLTK
jgi:hypothetical protein